MSKPPPHRLPPRAHTYTAAAKPEARAPHTEERMPKSREPIFAGKPTVGKRAPQPSAPRNRDIQKSRSLTTPHPNRNHHKALSLHLRRPRKNAEKRPLRQLWQRLGANASAYAHALTMPPAMEQTRCPPRKPSARSGPGLPPPLPEGHHFAPHVNRFTFQPSPTFTNSKVRS